MKKKVLIIFLMIFSICLVGCVNNPNTDSPLLLSSQELDGVFNPFYSWSAPDSQIVSMTQIGMLGNDAKGKVVYGEN